MTGRRPGFFDRLGRGGARTLGMALALGACAAVRPGPGPSEGSWPSPAEAFEAARLHHQRGDLPAALAVLDRLAAGALAPSDRVRALTERGVVRLEDGDALGAERSLREALDAAAGPPPASGLPAEALPKAHFWLGEVLRSRFQAASIDFAASEEAQAAALEALAGLLLEAQAAYLQAARPGAGEFGVAAVARVGELYESFHDRLAAAPLPPDLTEEEAAAWRAEVWRRLEVLLGKAGEAYQAALEVARRGGAGPALLEELERSLARLRALRPPPGS